MVNIIQERKNLYFESGRRLREEKLRNGILSLTSQGLIGQDLKQIFCNLLQSKEGTDEPPRKRQRVQGKEAFIARLSPTYHIVEVDLSYNYKLGETGMGHIHLLPDRVHTLNLSNCGLDLDGFRTVCKFLETNKTITQIGLGDPYMSNAKAECVGKMLEKNTTLLDLSIRGLGKEICRHLGNGLLKNKTLKRFGYFHKSDHEELSYFASILLQGGGAGLECFRVVTGSCGVPEEFESVISTWIEVVQKCEGIKELGVDHNRVWGPHIHYWLELNRLQARKVTRDGKREAFIETLEKASRGRKYDGIQYLLQNNARYLK
eukprot:scaffold22736_cov111-Cylindrotheca_fusiformis.AAC.5